MTRILPSNRSAFLTGRRDLVSGGAVGQRHRSGERGGLLISQVICPSPVESTAVPLHDPVKSAPEDQSRATTRAGRHDQASITNASGRVGKWARQDRHSTN